jgi:RNA polymerase sigma-70 factor (ECF subfamily)
MHPTPPSLLEQLHQPGNHSAWERFVALNAPLLHCWARRLGVQAADAENLVQEVFVTLLQELPRFHLPRRGDPGAVPARPAR